MLKGKSIKNNSKERLVWLLSTPRKTEVHALISLVCLGLIHAFEPDFFDLLVKTLSDAYLGVSVFVATTLAVFYAFSNAIKPKLITHKKGNHFMQVGLAALLGALPGCGGAIIVVTQFVSGKMSFGALVAVLISTMGDAAFLLIAREPKIALMVYLVCFLTGVVFGSILNLIHGEDYLRPEKSKVESRSKKVLPALSSGLSMLFVFLVFPGVVMGVALAMQIDTDLWFKGWSKFEPTKWIGMFGALLCLLIWYTQPLDSWSARFSQAIKIKNIKETVVAETSFITVWVILGFLAYEMLVYFFGLDLNGAFSQLGFLVIAMAVLVGLVPGCGPQIVMTTLFINGVIPFSAQLANAISNDGDALFPAIAMAPKAAIVATFYSAMPALLIGYTFYYLGM